MNKQRAITIVVGLAIFCLHVPSHALEQLAVEDDVQKPVISYVIVDGKAVDQTDEHGRYRFSKKNICKPGNTITASPVTGVANFLSPSSELKCLPGKSMGTIVLTRRKLKVNAEGWLVRGVKNEDWWTAAKAANELAVLSDRSSPEKANAYRVDVYKYTAMALGVNPEHAVVEGKNGAKVVSPELGSAIEQYRIRNNLPENSMIDSKLLQATSGHGSFEILYHDPEIRH